MLRNTLQIRVTMAVAVALLSLSAAPARAGLVTEETMGEETPRSLLFELKFGPYKPGIDDEFSGGKKPYDTVFGGDSFLMSAVQLEYEFLQGYGTMAAGVGFAFGMTDGRSRLASGGEANEGTSLYLMPLNFSVSYHLDIFAERWSVPIVPYGRVGVDYVVWWSTDGLGDVSDWAAQAGQSASTAYGGVWGWHAAGGIKLLLDVLAPTMAHTFDIEMGVNNSYIFAEFAYLDANDFHSGNSMQLGDGTFFFGLAFEM